MKNKPIDSELLLTYLKDKKIATIDELKSILRTQCRMTVFRKLSKLDYISSYSHRGKYYSLKRIARYNKYGIWTYKSVLFSQNGTLKKTIEFLINSSTQGYTASELNSILKVKVENTLLELVRQKIIIRQKISGIYIYFSKASKYRDKQELTRVDKIQCPFEIVKPDISTDELKATLIIFFSTLDEKQRRLYAGYESLKIGHGGDKRIAELLDLDPKTVARGRKELLGGKVNADNIREPGGGRKQIEKRIPNVVEKIEELMKYETAGDPMSNLKWTRKTTQKIADELATINIKVSKTTVAKILKDLDFSLKTNIKTVSNGGKVLTKEEKEKRNKQFEYIKEMRCKFYKMKQPVISVDAKKTELVGNFKNPGTRYKREADLTNDHDFLTYAIGKAALYGIYDESENTGFVSIGMFLREGKTFTSSDTPEFAVESIERWWIHEGVNKYQEPDEILIEADAGGSNGYRPHMWKVKLQEILCDKHGLKVTVCHYPPGASKWNLIEHRLFSEITKNWQATPLIDYETVLKYIKSTKTTTGLEVTAVLVDKKYKKGIKASKDDLKKLNIKYHETNPSWNYTLSPN